jgi:hypothetical protein
MQYFSLHCNAGNQVLMNLAFRATRMIAEHILETMVATTFDGWQVLPTLWFKPGWAKPVKPSVCGENWAKLLTTYY